MSLSQLVLGTARFGLDGYGFLAGVPKIPMAECERIVATAWDAGVRWIETAEAYGDAEDILGSIGVDQWRVVTKFPRGLPPTAYELQRHLDASESSLGQAVDGYLLHDARLSYDYGALGALKSVCLDRGIAYYGVACYEPDEAFSAINELLVGATMISVPHNLLDLRAWHAGVFVEAERRGAVVLARQPFCQGLLAQTVPQAAEKPAMAPHLTRLQAVSDVCMPANSPKHFALAGALLTAPQVVLGVDTAEQLAENAAVAMNPERYFDTLDGLRPRFAEFGGVSEPLCNPSRFAQT